MTHNLFIHLPANKRLVWYLAAEEYFAKNIHLLNQTYTKGIQHAVAYSHYFPVYNPPSNPLIFMHTHL